MDLRHYYGDIARRYFFAGGALMLLGLPFVQAFVPVPVFIAILASVIAALLAGSMTPARKRWSMMLDVLAAAFAVVMFEAYAVNAYTTGNWPFFFANEILTLVFFAGFYYATKTLRGAVYGHKEED